MNYTPSSDGLTLVELASTLLGGWLAAHIAHKLWKRKKDPVVMEETYPSTDENEGSTPDSITGTDGWKQGETTTNNDEAKTLKSNE